MKLVCFSFRVTFPASVAWMALEMDPRSGTAQPEDSLRIFASRSYDWYRSTLDCDEDSDTSCDFEEDQVSESDSFYLKTHSMSDIMENPTKPASQKLTMIPITGKMSNK